MLLRITLSIFVAMMMILFTLQYTKYMPAQQMFTNFSRLVFSEEAQKEIDCLADNIFFEAAYEPDIGKKAVAFVTLNRVNSGLYPNTVCGVVKQKNRFAEKTVCQFSWYCEDGPKRLSYSKNLTPQQKVVYNQIYELAAYVYVNHSSLKDPSQGAMFYHADYVSPGWRNVIRTTTIGRHIFYTRRNAT